MALIVEIGADWGKLKDGLKDASKHVDQFSKSIGLIGASATNMNPFGVLKGALDIFTKFGPEGLIVGTVITTLTGGMLGLKKAMDGIAERENFAEASGLSLPELAQMEAGLGRVGIRINELPAMMSQLRMHMRGLGDITQPTTIAFARLGLSAKSFEGKTMMGGLRAMGAAMKEAKNSTDALDAATTSLGQEKGPKMMPVLINLAQSSMQANPAAGVQEAIAPQVATSLSMLSKIGDGIMNFFTGILDKILPYMNDLEVYIRPLQELMLFLGELIGTIIAGFLRVIWTLKDVAYYINYAVISFMSLKDAFSFMGRTQGPKNESIEKYKKANEYFFGSGSESSKARAEYGIGSFARQGPGINEPIPATKPLPVIAESLTKVGGGGFTWGGDMAISIQREQLVIQNKIANTLERAIGSGSGSKSFWTEPKPSLTPSFATGY